VARRPGYNHLRYCLVGPLFASINFGTPRRWDRVVSLFFSYALYKVLLRSLAVDSEEISPAVNVSHIQTVAVFTFRGSINHA
jgi:hypothetical protein